MPSKASTVAEYLKSLPADRRETIEAVRKVILANLDKDYEEGIQYGMIGYYVPHRIHPAGYHCDPKQPLPFGCLGSQKNHISLHLMPVYGDAEGVFRKAWLATGKKLDMGKCCVRFKKLEDVALEVIGETVRRFPARKYIEICVSAIAAHAAQKAAGKGGAKKPRAKSAAQVAPAQKKAFAKKSSKSKG